MIYSPTCEFCLHLDHDFIVQRDTEVVSRPHHYFVATCLVSRTVNSENHCALKSWSRCRQNSQVGLYYEIVHFMINFFRPDLTDSAERSSLSWFDTQSIPGDTHNDIFRKKYFAKARSIELLFQEKWRVWPLIFDIQSCKTISDAAQSG